VPGRQEQAEGQGGDEAWAALHHKPKPGEPDTPNGKIAKIVATLDKDSDGSIDTEEVKVLFSRLFGVPESEIPDDDDEVVKFAGLSTQEMTAQLEETSLVPTTTHGIGLCSC
jgi:Ca2+-binding EF-hand superfamily protein